MTKIDEPILTMSQVREWQARSADLANKIRGMQDEHAVLARRLEAAKVLMGDLPLFEQPTKGEAEAPLEAVSATETLSDAALVAVDALGNLPEPAAIRAWILKEKPALRAKLKDSPNYFYTVLLRHVQKGRLIRDGAGYRRASSSPQGETGAVAAPVVVTH